MEDVSEKVFYENGNVFVTNARMNFGGATYATANISSVSVFEVKPKRTLEIIIGLAGLIILTTNILFGLLVIALAILIFIKKKAHYSIRLSSNAGEKDAIFSKDLPMVESIVDAINQAIIYRG